MKKQVIVRVISIILFIALLFAILIKSYGIFSWKDTSGDYFSSMNQMYDLNDEITDVAFFGPSVFYNGINPAVLWEKEGIASFNNAVAGQDRNASFYFVKEFTKKQSPKVVVLSSAYLFADHYDLEGNLYRNTISMKNSENYKGLVNRIVPSNEKSPNNKLTDYYIRWPIIHGRYKELTKYDFVDKNEYKYTLGFAYTEEAWENGAFDEDSLDFESIIDVSEPNREWMDKMKALADEEGFELMIAAMPRKYDFDTRAKLNACFDYAESIGIKCIDVNEHLDEIGFDATVDMCDASHPNGKGAYKISALLCDFLKANYNLEDRRNTEGYEIYDRALQTYRHNVLLFESAPSMNADELLSLNDNFSNLVYTVTYHPNEEKDFSDVYNYLLKCGVDEAAINAGGTWIIENDTVLKAPAEKTYGVKVNKTDYLYVLPTANVESYFDTVYVNDTKYVDYTDNECVILIYDKVLERVIAIKSLG